MRKAITTSFALVMLLAAQSVYGGWVKQSSGTLSWLRTVSFSDSSKGWIGGSNGTLLVTEDGGETWRPGTKFTTDSIRKIHFVDPLNGWALCERDIYSLGSQTPSYLMRTIDGGKTWIQVNFRNSNRRRITKIIFSESGHGIAVGEMGTIYGLEEDRMSWEKLASPTIFLMLDGAFGDRFNGAIAGGGGTIFFTQDAGATWGKAVLSESTRSMLRSVFFVDGRRGWVAGSNGRIYQTINGGKYWRRQRTGTAADLNDLYFVDGARGWAVGEKGILLQTSTGGNVWRHTASKSRNNLEDITFNGATGWIVGFGGTLLRYDANSAIKSKPKLNR